MYTILCARFLACVFKPFTHARLCAMTPEHMSNNSSMHTVLHAMILACIYSSMYRDSKCVFNPCVFCSYVHTILYTVILVCVINPAIHTGLCEMILGCVFNPNLWWFEIGPCRLICLNIWSPICRTVWKGLGGIALLEEVWHRKQALMFSKPTSFPVSSLCLVLGGSSVSFQLTAPVPCLPA